jgi:heterodisulfide reductase subunit C
MENNQNLRYEIERMSDTSVRKCMRCGKCSATCPNYDEMDYHPEQFVTMVGRGEIDKLLESNAIYTCLSCMACVERCPRQVAPAKIIEAVKLIKIRQQGKNHLKPEQVTKALDEELPAQALTSAFRKYSK